VVVGLSLSVNYNELTPAPPISLSRETRRRGHIFKGHPPRFDLGAEAVVVATRRLP
jgi:hypothetical protein